MRSWTERLTAMVSVTAVATSRNVDFDALWTPDSEAREEGFTDNRDYEPIGAVSWARVRDVADLEHEVLEQLAANALDADSFEDSVADSEYENAPVWDLGGLELGVASAVLALSAAGCVTCFSCRGHGGPAYPQVRFAAEAPTARLVVECASRSGCGVDSDEEGLLWVCAPSLIEMFGFADALIDVQEQFPAR